MQRFRVVYIHLIGWFNILYARIFCELRSIFPSAVGARKNSSNEQNVRRYYMFNRRIRDLLFQVKSGSFSPVILLLRFRP